MAVPAEDGGIDLFVATQWLHIDRKQLAPCLNLPEDKVRLFLAGTGGAFGAREDVSMQIHACMLALHTGRPVKMAYGRAESFVGHVHRHPSRIWMRTGATRGGDLVERPRADPDRRRRVHVVVDRGDLERDDVRARSLRGPERARSRAPASSRTTRRAARCAGSARCRCVSRTRGRWTGSPQALAMDPVELRLRNAAATGTILPTGQVIRGAAPVREVIERCAAIAMPSEAPAGARDPVELPGGVAGNVGRGEGVRRGVGFAVGYKNHAYSGGFDDSSEARVTLSAGPEGPVAEVHCAAAEVGQGRPHDPRADRADGARDRARDPAHLGHAGRVGGLDLGLAADRGLGRRGQGGVRGGARGPVRTRPARREAGRIGARGRGRVRDGGRRARGAGRGAARPRRSSARACGGTPRPTRSTNAARATST